MDGREKGKNDKDTDRTALAHCFLMSVYYFRFVSYWTSFSSFLWLAGWSKGAMGTEQYRYPISLSYLRV